MDDKQKINKEIALLKKENKKLKEELELKEAEEAKRIRDEQYQEKLRIEKFGNLGLTFDGVLLRQHVPYRIVVVIKYQPDAGVHEDLKETLKRFEQHLSEFSYSRGDVQVLISNIKRLELNEAENKKIQDEAKKEKQESDETKKENLIVAGYLTKEEEAERKKSYMNKKKKEDEKWDGGGFN